MQKVSRHKQRIWVLQILYGLDIRKKLDLENYKNTYDNFIAEKGIIEENLYAAELLEGIIMELELLDAQINKYAINWDIERMPTIDRNILRIAAYEIQHEIPVKVAINEAVKIAKKYADDSSPSFINGILSKFA
ncbi:MAG: N utilization substance protein B [Halanaerobium sp. 4-GBenrich]|jgi:N utilization substance protein B|uniref:Transcription antitermination protein NusB n=1 Tax=Halanaerobium congolense TaxID=54121 RepID=A0A1G6I0X5_9FIRM|nr:transcription antitermination factor NusB [Halanaerobium congolense]ODS50373.1 MAG: N utilization substance protein B [Halanaerobium sp. 4-GBenrich]OEG62043.1 MAG: transcription antitermination factor NusB [Halanaerobium sp. MDAL1]TDS31696.1 NusB antitermination factor [Halanaerobium congolense]SDC00048.1 NusB antitermination factor [Halanaerobium congolense]SHM22532.1 NusB antitermination factor [Halanaerobium congolense]